MQLVAVKAKTTTQTGIRIVSTAVRALHASKATAAVVGEAEQVMMVALAL